MLTRLILDTDIDTDCDDAGALTMLHALANAGECKLLGVVCSVPVSACVGAVRAINASCGRQTPVGLVGVPAFANEPAWAAYLAHHASFLRPASGSDPYNVQLAARGDGQPMPEEAVRLYRRLLAAEDDQSVTICAIGTLTALAQLLASTADEHSPLDGMDLVTKKVRELVTMAVAPLPAGREAFNWRMDGPSAARVLRDWPTPVTVSYAGATVQTGARFVAAAPADHAARLAYVVYLGGEGRSRSSWDQLAALYAVHGLSGPFALSGEYRIEFDAATADYRWQCGEGARRLVVPLLPDESMATIVEDLMIEALHLQSPRSSE